MTAVNRTTLYQYFQTGDKPTQSQFQDLIDSSLNLVVSAAQTIQSDVSALGSFSIAGLTTPLGGIVGTTTNNDASSGNIGEYISSTIPFSSAVPLTNNVAANITSISLTAGDWDVSGVVGFGVGGTTTPTGFLAAVGQTSATVPTGPEYVFINQNVTGASPQLPVMTTRFSLAVTTTIYLIGFSAFTTSTCVAFGRISARRVR